jgi:hypothetical protein
MKSERLDFVKGFASGVQVPGSVRQRRLVRAGAPFQCRQGCHPWVGASLRPDTIIVSKRGGPTPANRHEQGPRRRQRLQHTAARGTLIFNSRVTLRIKSPSPALVRAVPGLERPRLCQSTSRRSVLPNDGDLHKSARPSGLLRPPIRCKFVSEHCWHLADVGMQFARIRVCPIVKRQDPVGTCSNQVILREKHERASRISFEQFD